MSTRHCATRRQLFIKRWPICPVSRRAFSNGNAEYNAASRLDPTVIDSDVSSPIPSRRTPTEELNRRARMLQTWQKQLGKKSNNAQEQTPGSESCSATGNPPVQLPERSLARKVDRRLVRRVKIDETAAAIAGAIRYYLKPRTGKAREKAELRAAADPMLQYALSPEYNSDRGDDMDVAVNKAVQTGKGHPQRIVPERRRRDTVDIRTRRPSQLRPKSLNFQTAVVKWKAAHLPPPQVYDRQFRTRCVHVTRAALLQLTLYWVDALGPKFTKGQIYDIAIEVLVFKRLMAERYERSLQQSHPRIGLQYTLLNGSLNVEIKSKEVLNCLDNILEDDSFRISPVGKNCEVFAQKLDLAVLQYSAMSKDFVHRLGQYIEKLSDEEIACKLRTVNARAASRPPYFDPRHYSGTIDPVFWPRTPRLGI
ncbi:hypothetical protein E6O75_ATG03352 [Venturia nashicola]|uniref:Uncharacterized protein n=1 Tax=Venturia nashicola TaxID=86259 RepID=A0A4Z1PEU5_9PEZI|nr:hypothetical protein E6O75_ATG03352 [Venturia nashicola]